MRSGAYLGAAAVPQEFDLRYFKLYLSAPYSKKLDCHLYIHLRYPERTSKEFLEEFRTLTGKFEGLLDAEPLPPLPTARLNVIRYWSPDRGNVRSYQEQDGKQVLHGVQVSFGENNRLREMSVYNAGVLEHRTQFYADGFTFRAQRREHNGDGRDVIYAPIRKPIAEIGSESEGVGFAPLKSQAVVYEGLVKGDRPWSGSFLVRGIAGFRAVLNLEEYREGLLFSTKPFPVEKFSLPTVDPDAGKWLWEYPDWPNR
ncbi:MAG: hypothetical protein K8U03_03085 [Planctomycetia bacterium]|nr:hypothetical protein [Planctomycetia bacterium]